MKLRILSILALGLVFAFAEVSLGQTSREPAGKEAEEEEGMAPMAPLGSDPEWKFQDKEKTEEPERAKRPDVFPEAPTGELVPTTIEALKEQGEAYVNKQVLLKVYFGTRGSLSASRYGLKGKYHNFTVRNRELAVLNRVWIPAEKEELLKGLRRGGQITVQARVHDVTTLSSEPVLEVSNIKRGWLWKIEDFLPKVEEVIATPTPPAGETTPPTGEATPPPPAEASVPSGVEVSAPPPPEMGTPPPDEGAPPPGVEAASPPPGGEPPPSEGGGGTPPGWEKGKKEGWKGEKPPGLEKKDD